MFNMLEASVKLTLPVQMIDNTKSIEGLNGRCTFPPKQVWDLMGQFKFSYELGLKTLNRPVWALR